MHVSIIIPAYNEETRIGRTLNDYSSLLGEDVELIVVVEGEDQTESIVKSFAKRHRKVRLIYSKERSGKGEAVTKGMKIACKVARDSDIVGFVDADDSTSAHEAWKMIRHLEAGDGEGVIGNRYWRGIGGIPMSRFIASRAYNVFVRTLFGFPFDDTQCGAKFFRAGALKGILGKIVLKDMSFDINLLYELQKRGKKVEEVRINYNPIYKGSTVSTGRLSANLFISTLRYRFKKD